MGFINPCSYQGCKCQLIGIVDLKVWLSGKNVCGGCVWSSTKCDREMNCTLKNPKKNRHVKKKLYLHSDYNLNIQQINMPKFTESILYHLKHIALALSIFAAMLPLEQIYGQTFGYMSISSIDTYPNKTGTSSLIKRSGNYTVVYNQDYQQPYSHTFNCSTY